jgi:hypothetical protein
MVQFIYSLGYTTDTTSTCTSDTSYGTWSNKIERNEVMEKVTGLQKHVWVGSINKELKMVPMIVHVMRYVITKVWGLEMWHLGAHMRGTTEEVHNTVNPCLLLVLPSPPKDTQNSDLHKSC